MTSAIDSTRSAIDGLVVINEEGEKIMLTLEEVHSNKECCRILYAASQVKGEKLLGKLEAAYLRAHYGNCYPPKFNKFRGYAW